MQRESNTAARTTLVKYKAYRLIQLAQRQRPSVVERKIFNNTFWGDLGFKTVGGPDQHMIGPDIYPGVVRGKEYCSIPYPYPFPRSVPGVKIVHTD